MGAGHRHLEGDETRRADSAMAMKKARDFWRSDRGISGGDLA
jgi:hypothetical protein